MSIFNYWGKTAEDGNYHLLPYHCLDVAAVGSALFNTNPALLGEASIKLGLSSEKCRSWLLFFLALHDVGKFSTSFQNLKPELFKFLQKSASNKKYTIRHDSLGYFCWDKHLIKRFTEKLKLKEKRQIAFWLLQWAKWSAGHHGMPPATECRELSNYFRQADLDAVDSFTDHLVSLFKLEMDFDVISGLDNKIYLKQFSWLMAGLVTVCDWLGSNVEYFPLNPTELSLNEYWKQSCKQAECAVQTAGIVPAAVAASNNLFALFPEYAETATPLQSYCDQIEIPETPQLWVLEDVTGAGKTEAALTLAGRMMTKGLGQGCFIALPTMATSNVMYDRMSKVYSKLFKPNEKPSLLLAHGSRHLSDNFQESFFEFDADNFADNGEKKWSVSAQCSRWLADSSKKALLADVGVGTVDQVLLGILPARHQSLRLLGMHKKILIVDEVHSYDPYMNRLLESCLEFHAATGGSVILLSATLSMDMKKRLCAAYKKGLGIKQSESLQSKQFPLVTMVTSREIKENRVETRSIARRSVAVAKIDNIREIYDLIKLESAKGRCICWIRNTVHDVRYGYDNLLKHKVCKADDLMMFHSRFALRDRLCIEDCVVQKFGPSSTNKERFGQVLIASQVVEQSLDLDFDIMISDLAPIDLLIQRAGRLQRHQRKEPRDAPTIYLYVPVADDKPDKNWYKNIFPKACYVYPDTSNLWRTQLILREKGCISMPEDARYLIESVYGDQALPVPEALLFSEEEFWAKEMSDRSMASFNGLIMEKGFVRESSTHWDEETCIPTRLGDAQVNLYLARITDAGVKPFYPGKFAWDQSRLKIREGLLETLALNEGDKKALARFREESSVFYKNDLIVPVAQIGDAWVARGYNKNGNDMIIKYDDKQGLVIEQYNPDEE